MFAIYFHIPEYQNKFPTLNLPMFKASSEVVEPAATASDQKRWQRTGVNSASSRMSQDVQNLLPVSTLSQQRCMNIKE